MHRNELKMQNERFRIEMTVSCRDCDNIPKVANAGVVLMENGQRVQIMHNGLRVLAGGYYGEWMAEIISRLRGHHEPQEELIFHEVLKHLPNQPSMVELGGFWSYYTLWFLQEKPLGRAVVLEPDTLYLQVGQANARLNGRKVEFIHGCIGAVAMPGRIFQTESAGTLTLPQFTVPQLVTEKKLGTIDLLHCDVQGAETAVLGSCAELFKAGKIRFCLVSTHAQMISGDYLTHQRCLALLQSYGGKILAEHDVHESFSGDGFIAAYFGREPLDWPALKLSYNRYSTSLFRNPLYDLDEIALATRPAKAT